MDEFHSREREKYWGWGGGAKLVEAKEERRDRNIEMVWFAKLLIVK